MTSVPGPRSLPLQARRDATVARGVGATLPVFVDRAGGGVIVDIDGNSFIDFGAGIAVVSVGNAAPYYRRYRPAEFSGLRHAVLPLLEVAAIAFPLYELVKPGQPAPYNRFPLIWCGHRRCGRAVRRGAGAASAGFG